MYHYYELVIRALRSSPQLAQFKVGHYLTDYLAADLNRFLLSHDLILRIYLNGFAQNSPGAEC